MTGLHDVEGDVRARLALVVGGPVEGLERLSGGASRETWAFRAGERELILRRDPPGRSGEFGSMRLEAAVIRAAAGAGLAVPEVVAVDYGERLGTPGLVMARGEGGTVARGIRRDPGPAPAPAAPPAQLAWVMAR